MAETTHLAVRGCLEAFQRCESVLDAVPDDLYSGSEFDRDGIGSHLRHCLDHLECFNRGLDSGLIDYDARARSAELERDPVAFRSALQGACEELSAIPEARLDEPVSVRTTVALDSPPQVVQSTVARELAFLSSHVIHHVAVIAERCREHGIVLPDGISLAHSTSAFRAGRTG